MRVCVPLRVFFGNLAVLPKFDIISSGSANIREQKTSPPGHWHILLKCVFLKKIDTVQGTITSFEKKKNTKKNKKFKYDFFAKSQQKDALRTPNHHTVMILRHILF